MGTYKHYLDDLGPFRLSHQDEMDLGRRIASGDPEARDALITENMRLVFWVASHYLGRGLDYEDLVSVGTLGLIRAVDGFNPTRPTRFGTYACFWVRQAINAAILDVGKTIRVSRHTCELMARIHKGTERAPLTPRRRAILRDAEQSRRFVGSEYLATVADSRGMAQEGQSDERIDDLLTRFDRLPKQQRDVLTLRFGFDGEQSLSLRETGARMNLSGERVRQIQRTAIRALRSVRPVVAPEDGDV